MYIYIFTSCHPVLRLMLGLCKGGETCIECDCMYVCMYVCMYALEGIIDL